MSLATRPGRLFGTNGIRGIINEELTPDFVLEFSQAIGTFFQAGKVLVGHDGRTSSPALASVVDAGLTACGCQVTHIGFATTPMVQFLTKKWKMRGGVAVTASHNPPEYNGLKVIGDDGIEIEAEDELRIEENYRAKSWKLAEWDKVGHTTESSIGLEEYKASIKANIDQEAARRRKLKVVVDAANGVGALTTPAVLSELGCKVLTINANIDGTFPARQPEPVPGNLQQLSEGVRSSGADFGVAHDGDADRAIFVDDKGVAHWGDHSFALIEDWFLSANPGETIVTPVSSSQVVDQIAKRHGSKVVWTKVGSIHVSKTMQRIGARLGGEENGGIFYGPHHPVRDGAMAAALIAKILSQRSEALSTLFRKLPTFYSSKDKVPCRNDFKASALEAVRKLTSKFEVDTTDGIKVWQPDRSWVLIRPSGTEPAIRIFAEAKTQQKAKQLVRRYKALLQRFAKGS